MPLRLTHSADIFEVHMAVLEDLKNAIAVASDPSKANVAAVFLNHV